MRTRGRLCHPGSPYSAAALSFVIHFNRLSFHEFIFFALIGVPAEGDVVADNLVSWKCFSSTLRGDCRVFSLSDSGEFSLSDSGEFAAV
jgi:hypothetical protein